MSATAIRYRVTGMDCSACAAKIEKAAKAMPGINQVRVSIASGEMSLAVDDAALRLPGVEMAVTSLGYKLSRVDEQDNDRVSDLSYVTTDYKRALWTVVLLNVGYGVIELAGGVFAGSQALKADSLDFVGDGIISWLGVVAIGWGLAARAKAALLQGVFLGLLGLGVFAATIYRVFVMHTPGAELMGFFGLIALAVNVLAAVVLLPHRNGDANARAVWLFSRNDAIGNLAVVIAAVFVAWTASPMPDLIVAIGIAGLFLQSAVAIVRDARKDLVVAAKGKRKA